MECPLLIGKLPYVWVVHHLWTQITTWWYTLMMQQTLGVIHGDTYLTSCWGEVKYWWAEPTTRLQPPLSDFVAVILSNSWCPQLCKTTWWGYDQSGDTTIVDNKVNTMARWLVGSPPMGLGGRCRDWIHGDTSGSAGKLRSQLQTAGEWKEHWKGCFLFRVYVFVLACFLQRTCVYTYYIYTTSRFPHVDILANILTERTNMEPETNAEREHAQEMRFPCEDVPSKETQNHGKSWHELQ